MDSNINMLDTQTILCEKIMAMDHVHIRNVTRVLDKDEQPIIFIDLEIAPEEANYCPFCGKKCPGYDSPKRDGHAWMKTWRALDWGGTMVCYRASTHRIQCPEHGVVVAQVPWAYHNSCFTIEFDQTVTWLARKLPKSEVAKYMRIEWRTVSACISRVAEDIEYDRSDRYADLEEIGIDEVSYQVGHSYVTVLVNHKKMK